MPNRGPTDVEELIAQAAGLRRLAVRLVGESDADDVLQEAVAAGITHAPSDSSALRHWLVRVVRNLAVSRHRVAGRRAARELAAARPESVHATSALVERMEVQRLVAEEVLRLDEPYRTAVLAVYFEGLGAEEYARGLRVPSATVRSWLKRGLDALRTRLDRRFGGDRAAWSACLLPLARPEAAAVPLVIVGGLAMKKLVIAAAVVLLSALAWWIVPGAVGPAPDGREPLAGAIDLARPGPAFASLAAPVGDTAAESARRVSSAGEARTVNTASGRVTGRVTWKPDGTPAVDIGVRLVPDVEDSQSGAPPLSVTDREGRFDFESVAPGAHELRLDRSRATEKVTVRAGGAHAVELSMARAPDVVGRVLDPDGTPVPGAEVHLRESDTWTRLIAVTGPDGAFRFEGGESWVTFFARAAGRAPSGMRQATKRDRPLDLYLGGVPGRIVGQVVDPRGNPSAGALVEAVWFGGNGVDPAGNRVMSGAARELRVDADGRFSIDDAQPGTSTLRALATGFPWVRTEVDVRPGSTSEVRIDLPQVARVRGRVSDSAGRAVEGATIQIVSKSKPHAWASVRSDRDGRFDLDCVSAGHVRGIASHGSGTTSVLDFELAPGADFDWSPTIGAPHPIRGRLVDLAGQPLAGRTIRLTPLKRTATTDAEGRFAFDGLREQTYELSFEDDGLTARAEDVVPSGEDVVLVAERPSARILGRVADAEGRPLERVRLTCDGASVLSARDGAFEFADVRSGRRSVELLGQRIEKIPLASVTIGSGEVHDIGALVVPGQGSFHVRVRSDEGVPIEWAFPGVRRVGQADGWLRAPGWDARGVWAVSEVPTGDYEFSVSRGAAMQLVPFTVRAGERTDLEVELRFGTSVEFEFAVLPGALPLRELEFEIRGSDGAVVGRESWRSAAGAPSRSGSLTLAPGSYECMAHAPDGRAGSSRFDVRSDGPRSDVVRIELR